MKVKSVPTVEIIFSGAESQDLFDFLHDYKLEYLGDDPFPMKTVNALYNELDSILYPESK
jgi:hypothetical protein